MTAHQSFLEYLRSLNETPFDVPREIRFTGGWDSYTSTDTINRTSRLIAIIDNVRFYFKKDKSQIIGYVDGKDYANRQSNRIVFDLSFKSSPILDMSDKVKNPLYVDTVDIDPKYASRGLSTKIYVTLAKLGYTIVSRNTLLSSN